MSVDVSADVAKRPKPDEAHRMPPPPPPPTEPNGKISPQADQKLASLREEKAPGATPSKAETDAAIKTAEAGGYKLVEAKDTGPKVGEVAQISRPGEFGPGVLRYETIGGDKKIVAQDRTPEAYRQAQYTQQATQALDQYKAEGYKVADRNLPVPSPDSIATIGTPSAHQPGVLTFTTRAGDRYAVSKDLTPDIYARVQTLGKLPDVQKLGQTVEKAKVGGYDVVAATGWTPAVTDFKKVGGPAEFGDGVIRVEMQDGHKYVVQKDLQPEAYDQAVTAWQHFKAQEKAKADGFSSQLPADMKTLPLTDLKEVSPLDRYGNGVLTTTTTDGKKYWVSQYNDPAAYQALAGQGEVLQDMQAARDAGYKLLSSDGFPPLYKHIESAEVVGDSGQVLAYTTIEGAYPSAMGQKHYITAETNPKSFAQVQSYLKAQASPEVAKEIEKQEKKGGRMLEPGDSIPDYDDITEWTTSGSNPDTMRIKVKNPRDDSVQEYFVSKTQNPEGYEKLESLRQTQKRVNALADEGYQEVGEDQAFKDGDIKTVTPYEEDKVFAFTDQKDGKWFVREDGNPALYKEIRGKYDGVTVDNVESARKKHDIDSQAEGVFDLKTTEPVDKEKPDGDKLTVGSLATKNLLDQYQKGIDDGSIAADDPRAQLVRAIQAKSAADNGLEIIDMVKLRPEDMQSLIKTGTVDNRLLELFADKEIQKDFEGHLKNAAAKVPDRAAAADKLYENLTSDGYLKAVDDLGKSGMTERASRMLQHDLMSLQLLDPEKAAKAKQKLAVGSMKLNFEEGLRDPGKVDQADVVQASKDLGMKLARLGKSAAGATHFWPGTDKYINEQLGKKVPWDKVIQEFPELADQTNWENFGKLVKEAMDNQRAGKPVFDGIDLTSNGLTEEQLQKAVDKAYIPFEQRGDFQKFVYGLNKYGILGTAGASVAMASFAYRVQHGAFGANSTWEQRWAASRDLISFFSQTGNMAKTMTGIADQVRVNVLGKEGPNHWRNWLGIDKSLPEIWGKGGTPDAPGLPSGSSVADDVFPGSPAWGDSPHTPPGSPPWGNSPHTPPGSPTFGEYSTDLDDALSASYDDLDANVGTLDDILEGSSSSSSTAYRQAVSDLASDYADDAARAGVKVLPSVAQRVAGTVVKVLGTTLDLFGFVDAGMSIYNLTQAKSTADIVLNSISLVGGIAGGTAGAIGTAGLFTTVPAWLASAATPLFFVGALAGGIAILGSVIADSFKRDKIKGERSKARGRQYDWLESLHKDGFVVDDYKKKIDFAWKSNWIVFQRLKGDKHRYGEADFPAGISVWDAQPEEYANFADNGEMDHRKHRYAKDSEDRGLGKPPVTA